MRDPAATAAVAARLLGPPMSEREAFAPRAAHPSGVYSGSKWPADEPMCPHNELSYAAEFPRLMLFACAIAPETGGATTLADGGRMLTELPPAFVAGFEEHGWTLRRQYGEVLGIGLAEAFGASSRQEIERYCHASEIAFDWAADGQLRTWQRRPAVARHPVTGRRSWFNQIAFLNAWTLDPDIRAYILAVHGPSWLPFDTARGDGQPVSQEDVDVLHRAYERATVRVPWQDGDLLLVDNIAMAHGREPYQGQREILVAMGAPARGADLV